MKTLIILVVSSLFFSNVSNDKADDSISEIMKTKLPKSEFTISNSTVGSRMPIIIIKRD